MKNNITKKVCILLMTILLISLCMPTTIYASSTASKAKAAYKSFLKKSSITFTAPQYYMKDTYSWKVTIHPKYFNLVDIDKNGVQELIVTENTSNRENYVFTYKSGKVKCVGIIQTWGGGDFTYNPSTHGFISYYSGSGANGYGFWQLKNGVLKETKEVYTYYNLKETYEYNYKKCSKSTFNKYYNKYFKESTLKNVKFVKNSSSNRSKKLG